MKNINWKTLFITSAICLCAIIPGILVWDRLPEVVPIHFDINNNPDNFANKGFVVFGLPVLMAFLQVISCVICDINSKRYGKREKFVTVTEWIVPVLAIVLQAITLIYGIGIKIDIRAYVAVIVGLIFIVMGNYMPKFDSINGFKVDTYKARIINRFIGKMSIVLGLLFIISVFFPPVATLVCLLLLIPYTAISIIYAVRVCKKKLR